MAIMANYWARAGWTVALITLNAGASFYELDPAVRYIPLGLQNISQSRIDGVCGNFRRIMGLRRAIGALKPQVVVSMLGETNVTTIAACLGLGIPVLVQEQIDPAQHLIGAHWAFMRRLLYPLASRVVVLGKRSMDYFATSLHGRTRIIPNPALNVGTRRQPSRETKQAKVLVAIGRLVPQKGFDALLKAFSKAASLHPEWRLMILGEGPMRPTLEAMAHELGIWGRITMPGIMKDPFKALCESDLFVMSSRYEGFPLSLCEAMGCGLPVVSFDCPSGPGEIIRDGHDGILVRPCTVEALSEALERLMSDSSLREYLAERAPEVLERYSVPKIMAMWEDVIREVAFSSRE